MQRLFQQPSGLEVGLAAGRDIDNLARARISRGGLGPRVLDLKDPEAPDFDAVALNQAVPHGDKQTVYHLRGQVLLAPRALADEEGQILLGYGGQEHPPEETPDGSLNYVRNTTLVIGN